MAQTILLIEDNEAFRKTVAGLLSQNGYDVRQSATGKAGLVEALEGKPDLVVLDLILPGIKGTEVCRQLKEWSETAGIPVLILTGNDKDGQEVALLDLGADDYLTKPVKTELLLAHCRALLRRPAARVKKTEVGALELDYDAKVAVFKGKAYPHLTPKEFELLFELAKNAPAPIDRAELYRRVWGMEAPSEGSLKTVDVHARRIRLKLGWESDAWLTYVNGRGYCLSAPK